MGKKKSGCATILVIILILGAIGYFVGGNKNNSNSSNNNNNNTPKTTNSAKTSTTEAAKPAKIYGINDTVSYDNIEVKINRVVFSQYAGDINGLNKAQDGLLYCVIYLDVKNTTNKALDLVGSFHSLTYNFTLVYDKEVSYYTAWSSYSDFLFANETIPARATLKGKVISFSVPAEMKTDNLPLELTLTRNDGSNKTKITWNLR